MNSLSGIAGYPLRYRISGAHTSSTFFRLLLVASAFGGGTILSAADLPADPSALKPYQRMSVGKPPLSPADFSPDAGVPPVRTNLFTSDELILGLDRQTNHSEVLPLAVFNPDPGAMIKSTPEYQPFFTNEFRLQPDYDGQPIETSLELPRTNLVLTQLQFSEPSHAPAYGSEPLNGNLKLPRLNTVQNEPIPYKYRYSDYPLSEWGTGYPQDSEPEANRWRIGFVPWRRYTSGGSDTPYETPAPMLWHPYHQSLLKGDLPIIGQDIFLDLTASSETVFEGKRVPTPSGISASQAGAAEFYGQSEQISVENNFSFAVDLFKGDTSFKPVQWAIHLQPVYNINYIQTHETGAVSPDPRGVGPNNNVPPPSNGGISNPGDIPGFLNGQLTTGPSSLFGSGATTRTKEYFSLQEAFFELHLGDLSESYDFAAMRVGNQVFNQDFRGFLFNDVNTALRIFGNIDDNRYQYNVAVFDMREKDTDSELNTFDSRQQRVVLANIYRQDFMWHGYTAQLSFLANLDNGGVHYDDNGFLVRPEPIGTLQPHDVHAYYLGWAGDGHIGRFNVTHQFYEVVGHDDFNDLAGRPQNINAQMAALETSYDQDWIRYKASAFYASGDHKVNDGTATGFDTVVDNPNFTGGPFSYWTRQGFNFGGTAVNLKQANSLVPDLRSSKTEGQANFVNPGVLILGLGTEMDLMPKLRCFMNANYIRFMETDPLKTALLTDNVAHEVGWDLSIGFQYRPLLTDNIIISAGFGTLIPGSGYRDIYRTSTDPLAGYNSTSNPGHADDFLYSGLIAVTFTY